MPADLSEFILYPFEISRCTSTVPGQASYWPISDPDRGLSTGKLIGVGRFGREDNMGEGEPVVGDDFKYSTGLTTAGRLRISLSFRQDPMRRW